MAVLRQLLTWLMLLTIVSNYIRSYERKNNYDFDELDLVNGKYNGLCHFEITRRRFPMRVMPKKDGSRAYLALLLILSGDIELNPGPIAGTSKVKTRSTNQEMKEEAVNFEEIEITDINSVISKFCINPNLPIPKEHSSKFLDQFKGKDHFSYTTGNLDIAGTILAYYHQIYDKLGLDDDYNVSWSNLINTEKNEMDEIHIKIKKDDEFWLEVRISIPSAAICILGNEENINDFKKNYLEQINIEKEQYVYQSEDMNDVNPFSISQDDNESLLTKSNKSESETSGLKDVLKPVWSQIDILFQEINDLKKQSNLHNLQPSNKQMDGEQIHKENLLLRKENSELLNEIECLKKEIEKLKINNKEKPREDNNPWQKISRKPNQLQHLQHQVNHQTFHQPFPVYNQPVNNNIHTFFHPNKYDQLQYIPQETAFNTPSNITFPPLQTIPKTQMSSIRKQPALSVQTHQPHTLGIIPPKQNNHQTSQPRNSSSNNGQKQNISIVGDSMIKNILPHKMSRSLNLRVNKISIGGMKTEDLKYYTIPSINKSPDAIILHCGINDLMNTSSTPKQIGDQLYDTVKSIKEQLPTCKVYISNVVKQAKYTNINGNIEQLNEILCNICKTNNINYIDNNNITLEHLNGSKLHLNDKGTAKLASNFRDCIKTHFA